MKIYIKPSKGKCFKGIKKLAVLTVIKRFSRDEFFTLAEEWMKVNNSTKIEIKTEK